MQTPHDKEPTPPTNINPLQNNPDEEILVNQFLQELAVFRCTKQFLRNFHQKWENFNEIQSAFLHMNLRHLPQAMTNVMPAKFRYLFLTDILSERNASDIQRFGDKTRDFNGQFLELFNGSHREAMIGYLTQSIQILADTDQERLKRRFNYFLHKPHDTNQFLMARQCIEALAEKLPLSPLENKHEKRKKTKKKHKSAEDTTLPEDTNDAQILLTIPPPEMQQSAPDNHWLNRLSMPDQPNNERTFIYTHAPFPPACFIQAADTPDSHKRLLSFDETSEEDNRPLKRAKAESPTIIYYQEPSVVDNGFFKTRARTPEKITTPDPLESINDEELPETLGNWIDNNC